jgi:hypothetical protein
MSLLSFMASFASAATVALSAPAPVSAPVVSTSIVATGTDLEWNRSHLQYHVGDLGHRTYHLTKEGEHAGWHAAHDELSAENIILEAEHRSLHRRMNFAHRITHWGVATTVVCVPHRFPNGPC